MTFHCPMCRFEITINAPRAGSFTPRCPGCKQKFALTIPEGENATPRVRALPTTQAPDQPPEVTALPTSPKSLAPSPAATHSSTETMTPTSVTMPPPASASQAKAASRAMPANTLPRAGSSASSHTAPPASSSAAASAGADGVVVDAEVVDAALPISADMPAALGGYQMLKKLGQGGMGAVYLARQVSLDRPVAVKVLGPQLAADASFVARFTREAFAAAQLVHHHVVQVYDIGEDEGRHFYSMEFVDGDSLATVVERDGRLDPETAVVYALQAARGLKFAHDRGLVHRDVKPDNLMVNAHGIVKVADLGLVKQRNVADVVRVAGGRELAVGSGVGTTGVHASMGTPAYMAPEQARDAASVDQRADIYSLGCTLYDLLIGRPPFTGKTVVEVLTKHANEPVTPPDVVSKRVPKEVSQLLMKMIAKRPEDRYADTGQCIAAMEDFLGAGTGGAFAPKEEHAAALDAASTSFRNVPLAKAARIAVPAYYGVCALAAVMALLLGGSLGARVVGAGTFVGLGVLTMLAYVVVAGVTRRDVTLGKLRPLAFDLRIGDYVRGALVIGVGVLLLSVFGLLWVWAGVAVVAVGVAAAHHFGLQAQREKQRQPFVDSTLFTLRTLRLRGLDEETLRAFVCRYSGKHWEEFYESLFGYDAKMEARRRWGLSLRGRPRPKFGVWRDALVAWADARVAARKAARDKQLLVDTDAARLRAEGVDVHAARRAAEREAAAIVSRARDSARRFKASAKLEASAARAAATALPTAAIVSPMPTLPPQSRPAASVPVAPVVADEDVEPIERTHRSFLRRRHGGLLGLIFGPSVRFPVAMALLAAFFLWFHQTHPNFPNDLGRDAKAAVVDVSFADLGKGRVAVPTPNADAAAKKAEQLKKADLQLPMVPRAALHRLSGYGPGLAGALLLLSCMVASPRCGVLALAGAAVIVGGDGLVPGFGAYGSAAVAMVGGAALCVIGMVWGQGPR